MDFILDLVGFLLKTVIIVGLVALPIVVLVMTLVKEKSKAGVDAAATGALVVEDLKKTARERKEGMRKQLAKANPDKKLEHKEQATGLTKEEKTSRKAKKNAKKDKVTERLEKRKAFLAELDAKEKDGVFCPQNLYVIDFRGSTKGKEVKELRLKIDAILEVATDKDEVVINLTSPGGLVNSYGLCSSQLQRLRDRNIFVSVTVDEVAASGGYLMACVANKIVAAPFSYIGSIGVIAGIPNFRRVLNKYDVDYEQVTAGKFKRTLSVLGENTEEGRAKFKEELEAVHERFKERVLSYRPFLDADKIATGEHWLAIDAKELGLVDEIATSEEYIQSRMALTRDCALKIKWKRKEKKNLLKNILPSLRMSSPVKEAQKLEQSSFLNLK